VTLVDSVRGACAVATDGVVVYLVICFDGVINLDRSKGFVDGCFGGVTTEDDIAVESRSALS
jgi:hypothetical protein